MSRSRELSATFQNAPGALKPQSSRMEELPDSTRIEVLARYSSKASPHSGKGHAHGILRGGKWFTPQSITRKTDWGKGGGENGQSSSPSRCEHPDARN